MESEHKEETKKETTEDNNKNVNSTLNDIKIGFEENLRDTLEIPKEQAELEINSYRGSYHHAKEFHRNSKNNFPFRVIDTTSMVNAGTIDFQRPDQPHKKIKGGGAKINAFTPFKIRKDYTNLKLFMNKGKLGFEVMVYSGSDQVNCYFSKFTNKLLLAVKNKDTYDTDGCATVKKEMGIEKMAQKLNFLIDHKFRFRVDDPRRGKHIVISYLIRKYSDYILNEELSNQYFFSYFPEKRFVKFHYFSKQKKFIGIQVGSNGTRIVVFDIKKDSVPAVARFDIEEEKGKCYFNKVVSESIELLTFDFLDRMEFYLIKEEGGIELAYVYLKKRKYFNFINPRNESIIVVRREDIVTISELDHVPEGNYYAIDKVEQRPDRFHIEKFAL